MYLIVSIEWRFISTKDLYTANIPEFNMIVMGEELVGFVDS